MPFGPLQSLAFEPLFYSIFPRFTLQSRLAGLKTHTQANENLRIIPLTQFRLIPLRLWTLHTQNYIIRWQPLNIPN
jgi:hypothetical protein